MNKTDKFMLALYTFLILFLVLLLLAVIVIDVYAFIKYGDTPITEVPAWAYFFLFGGKS